MFYFKQVLMTSILYNNILAQQLQNQPAQQQTQIRFVEIPTEQNQQGMNQIVVQSSDRPKTQVKPIRRQLTPEEQYKQDVMQVYNSVDQNNLMPLYDPGIVPEQPVQTQLNMPSQLPQQSYVIDPELQSFYDNYLPQYNEKQEENQLQQGFLDRDLQSDGTLRTKEVDKEVADLSRGILRNRYIPAPRPKPKIPYPKAPKPKIYYTRQNQDGTEEVVKSQKELERERLPPPPKPLPYVPNTNFYENANIPGDKSKLIDTELIRYREPEQQQRIRGNRRSFPSNLSEDYEGRFNKIDNPISVPLDFEENQQQDQLTQDMTWEEYQQRALNQEAYDKKVRENPIFQRPQEPKVYRPQFVGQSQQSIQN